MAGSSDPASRAKQHARRIAAGLAKNAMPAPTADLEDYLERCPEDVLAALEGFAKQVSAGGADDRLAVGHLVLIQLQLERIRYRRDRGYEDAARLIETFQRSAVDLAADGRMPDEGLSMLSSALHHAGIAVSAEMSAAIARSANAALPGGEPPDLALMFEEIARLCGDPFVFVGMMAESGHAVPAPVRAAMAAEQARSDNAIARDAAILYVVDAEPEARRGAVAALRENAARLSPASLRRLIAIRNWCPEPDRSPIDAIVREARARGTECASWPQGSADSIHATCIDGSGMQGFVIVSPAGRRKRMSSVLLRNGVRDAWTGAPETRRQIESALSYAADESAMVKVSRGYLDRAVRHHLHLGLAARTPPPAGLLQVAETMGGAEWTPEPLDWRDALADLLAEVPAAMLKPQEMGAVLRTSSAWADLGAITDSWFEDDPGVARMLGDVRGRRRVQAVEYVLCSVLARRRDKWAEHFLWTALWMREAPEADAAPWRQFALVAHALASGRELSDIPLMHDIAARTVAAVAPF